MNLLPAGWQAAPLGDVCRVVSGSTPRTGEPEYWGGDVAWITPNDLSKDRSQVVHGGERSLTAKGYESCSARLFPAGSVIVSSRAPIGYVAIAGAEMCTNQGCKTAVPPEFIDSRYLYWFLVNARPDLEARASGTTFREISGRRFAETELWWPPISEQRRLVEALEEHLSRLDAAEAALRHAPDRLAIFKASAAVHALRPSAVSGSAVMNFGAVELPLPSSWRASTVGAEAVLVEYGSGAKATPLDSVDAVPVLRMGNVKDGRVVWDSLKYLPADHPDVAKLCLRAGDLLFNRTNSAELVGKSAVFGGERDAAFASYLIRVRFTDAVNPHWASFVINSLYGRSYVESVVSQQVGQANVNGTKLRAFPLPVPSRRVQDEIVARLHEQDQAARRLGGQVGQSTVHLGALRRSLLNAAFAGRLTGHASDQDLAQELADV